MSPDRRNDERQRILDFWWMVELLSPQSTPRPTGRATRLDDRQVIEWRPGGGPLPWQALPPPPPLKRTTRVWRHTVYLGVYALEDTYDALHRVFADDPNAYDERPGGSSACAGLLIDHQGRLVADSVVLSSALWAVGRAYSPGPGDPRWMEGFPEADDRFAEAVDEFEGARRAACDERPPGQHLSPPHDSQSLVELLRLAQRVAGVDRIGPLATDRLIIESVAVSARRAEEQSETDFLNSFFLPDLALVRGRVARGDIGAALTDYLTGDADLRPDRRVDVVRNPQMVTDRTTVGRLPRGRWPADPAHPLALSQQFAVNLALCDLAPTSGLLGVNGPPGTGKTTMLRDILAGNIVERARRLAALDRPGDAFTGDAHRWTAEGGHDRRVPQLRPELVGFEMVVASANNAAVQNVTDEIPALAAIHSSWQERADYFGAIATEVLRSAPSDGPTKGDIQAWGLVAARLGRKRNRSAFHTAFWFDEQDPVTDRPVRGGVPRLQTMLKQWADGTRSRPAWDHARAVFQGVEHRVDALLADRAAAERRIRQRWEVDGRRRDLAGAIRQCQDELVGIAHLLDRNAQLERQAATDRDELTHRLDRQMAVRPGVWETLFTLGRAPRAWRVVLDPIARQLAAAEERRRELSAHGQGLLGRREAIHRHLAALNGEVTRLEAEGRTLADACAADERQIGSGYPGRRWVGDARELTAPWLDAELDAARSDLFLAALDLHRDFLAAAADTMQHGLRAAVEVVAGKYPHHVEPVKVQAAWQLFFLVVPMISTTFASVGRMFAHLERESIGWLLIDEAGQAAPQYAAGAIWRARRVVAVGDPLQLQPVVTIPQKVQRDIARTHRLTPTWLPPRASAQTLVDRVAIFGTTLTQGEQDVWVSAPLRVHRRCDNPMFRLCNEIAYNGMMVDGVRRGPARSDPFVGPDPRRPLIAASHWADEPATTPGTHLQPGQIQRLTKALNYLNDRGVPDSDIIVISPFRAVADRLKGIALERDGLRAGTIHTAQGREAPVVILVLGGDPNSPGARAWAAATPNLVNVAASRAKRRLYVIGDRAAWAEHNYFRQLAAALAAENPSAG